MNSVFELLFCPQHGIFRSENLLMILTYGNGLIVEARCLLYRFGALVARWF
jgi:hypothetical protein